MEQKTAMKAWWLKLILSIYLKFTMLRITFSSFRAVRQLDINYVDRKLLASSMELAVLRYSYKTKKSQDTSR
jgi:hypothetical protein